MSNQDLNKKTNGGEQQQEEEKLNQSPIDIITSSTIFDPSLLETKLNIFIYNRNLNLFTLENTGRTFKLTTNEVAFKITGGPVKDHYKFLQLHMHWGNKKGSEHTVDGQSFNGEIHFVHWNCDKYASPEEAMKSTTPDGLLIFAVFVKIGKEHGPFNKIVRSVKYMTTKNEKVAMNSNFNLRHIFPGNAIAYWTYQGSLTSEPYTECAQWCVFRDPIEASNEQLNELQEMHECTEFKDCCSANAIKNNTRETLPLNNRTVYRSFRQHK